LDYEKPVSTDAQAKISIGSFLHFSTASVNFCRAISENARLLHPTKLPRRSSAIRSASPRLRVLSLAFLALMTVSCLE
jgi:hypothetical protein